MGKDDADRLMGRLAPFLLATGLGKTLAGSGVIRGFFDAFRAVNARFFRGSRLGLRFFLPVSRQRRNFQSA